MIHIVDCGCIGYGKSEQQRIKLGMTHEQYSRLIARQAEAHSEVLRLEKELADARLKFLQSCVVGERDAP